MSHDYCPDWDFDVLTTPVSVVEAFAQIEARLREVMLPALGFADMRIFFAGLDGPLGLYIDGTSSLPVIGVDNTALERACRRYGQPYVPQLEATIVHELGHAFQETCGSNEPDEQAVEQFARQWVEDGFLDVEVLKPHSS